VFLQKKTLAKALVFVRRVPQGFPVADPLAVET